MLFKDRCDAGRQLAEKLQDYRGYNVLVLAVPRGGVVVAEAIAQSLDTELDLIIPRKVGLPGNPELAAAAVAPDGTVIYNEPVLKAFDLVPGDLNAAVQRELTEIKRRLEVYRGNRHQPEITGRVVIIVDDGIATGLTITAALKSLLKAMPEKLVLAVPVAPPETLASLQPFTGEIVCLLQPTPFYAVGQFYQNFSQVSDDEVKTILANLQK